MEVGEKQDFKPIKAEKHESAGDRGHTSSIISSCIQQIRFPRPLCQPLDIEDIYANT